MTAAETTVHLRCRNLEVGYASRPILPPLEMQVSAEDFWVVVGRNGSGKTTCLRTLLGLLPPVAGILERPGRPRLSYIPQRTALDSLFPLRTRDVVALGADRGLSFLRPGGHGAAVRDALGRTGLTELARRPFRSLSEGQKQRALLGRLIASAPDVALLDEPTAAMDVVAEREALRLLDTLRRERGTAVMVVSHFVEAARELANRALFVDRDSATVLAGDVDEVLAHPVYRRSIGAVPVGTGAEASDA